jgi:hypothetical protein
MAGPPVYISPGGTYRLEGVVDVVDKHVMMVGHEALRGYAQETGRLIPDVFDPELVPVLSDLGPESLNELAGELTSLLGDERRRLEDADLRGRKSRTPPPVRHRLLRLAEYARATAMALSDWDGRGEFDLDGNLLAESVTAVAMARRWQNHPACPALRRGLIAETEHTVMLLAVASYLVDAGNGIGIHVNPKSQHVTTADIWIEPDLTERVDLEIKTPLALRSPKQPISVPDAMKVLERALKKSSHQRRNTRSSLLVIGGYHMGESYETVVSTAKGLLALERRRWPSLAGLVVVDCTYEAERIVADGSTRFGAIARVGIARHLGYEGGLSIQSDRPPTSPFE